jgi:hypothetical protein
MVKNVKFVPYVELEEKGYIYNSRSSSLVVTNGKGSYKAFPPDIFDRTIIVSDSHYVISEEEYKEFKNFFENR